MLYWTTTLNVLILSSQRLSIISWQTEHLDFPCKRFHVPGCVEVEQMRLQLLKWRNALDLKGHR